MHLQCLAALLICALASTAVGATVSIPVSEDASTNTANSGNLNNITTRGGLLSGLDDTGSNYSFYLKFILPDREDGMHISKAALIGHHTDDFGGPNSFHAWFFVPSDDWDETTITSSNAPPTGPDTGAGFESAGAALGEKQFDLTAIANQEYHGDGVLSLKMQTVDGRFGDLKFFASKEFDPELAFRLDLTISPIPLPPALASGLITLVGSAGAIWIRKRRRS